MYSVFKFHHHLFDWRTHSRVFERILGQVQRADPTECKRLEFEHDLAPQPNHIAVLHHHVHRAVVRMKRIRVQVQLMHTADGHHEICANVLHHALRPDCYMIESSHVERPKTNEPHQRLVADGQIRSAITI